MSNAIRPYKRVHGWMVKWRDAHGNSLFAHQLLLPALSALNQNAHWLRTHGGWSMPKTKVLPRFSIGDKVRVRSGVCDPDYDDLTIGGWAGTVGEVERGSPPTCLVRWNGETLKSQSSIYRRRCERDGFDGEEMWLGEDDLEPDTGDLSRTTRTGFRIFVESFRSALSPQPVMAGQLRR